MKSIDSIVIAATRPQLYTFLARQALRDATESLPDDDTDRDVTFEARRQVSVLGTHRTISDEVSFSPGLGVTRKLTSSSLRGSVEEFSIEVDERGRSVLNYRAHFHKPNGLAGLMAAILRWYVQRSGRRMIVDAKRAFEGESVPEGTGTPMSG